MQRKDGSAFVQSPSSFLSFPLVSSVSTYLNGRGGPVLDSRCSISLASSHSEKKEGAVRREGREGVKVERERKDDTTFFAKANPK